MDWTFFVQRLLHAVQDKILAIADGCLSRQYRGDARVCKFWLFRPDRITEQDDAVLDEVWRAVMEASRVRLAVSENEDGGEPCQTCGIRRRDLQQAYVAFVQITVHRRVTRIIDIDFYAADILGGDAMKWEQRAVCRECLELLFCPPY